MMISPNYIAKYKQYLSQMQNVSFSGNTAQVATKQLEDAFKKVAVDSIKQDMVKNGIKKGADYLSKLVPEAIEHIPAFIQEVIKKIIL